MNKFFTQKKRACPQCLQHGCCGRGFTLVETLIAVSIFSVSLVAVMAVLGSGISNTNSIKQKMTASYLAQEGIEYIRNMRDTYVLYSSSASTGWTSFNNKVFPACVGYGCFVNADNLDYGDNTEPINDGVKVILISCNSANCSNGALSYINGKYGFSGEDSGFTRKIIMTKIISPDGTINPNEVKVSSTVYWTQGSGPQSVTFSENLFNWVE